MPLSKEQVEHIARLARLKLTPAETDRFAGELTVILDYFDQIRRVNTDGISRTRGSGPAENVLRDDEVQPSLPCSLALQNAPDSEKEFFRVPRVLGK